MLLRGFKDAGKLEKVSLDMDVENEAIHLASLFGVHKLDSLHAALSLRNDCILVTFDQDLKQAAKHAGCPVSDPRELV